MTEKRDIRELALEALGFASLNAMQDDMLRVFPEGRDILLLAPTGSGKTLAYLLPLWQKGGRTLIIAPSRELVQQIADVWQRLHTDIRCVACYGGHDTRVEQQQLDLIYIICKNLLDTPCTQFRYISQRLFLKLPLQRDP